MFEKNIWIYWEQGWTDAPEICKLCKNSWEKLNEKWKINLLDKYNLNKFIDVNTINNNFWNINPIQTRSDLIRTLLLQKYGGVWVDATLICIKSLDNWLFKYFNINNNNDFYAFKKPEKKISFSSWFLVSHPNNYIINKLAERYFKYFKTNLIAKTYFQFHDDFRYLLKNDKIFFKYYSKNKKLSSDTARIFTCKYGFNSNLNINQILKIHDSPLYKLSHKIKLRFDKDTSISKLFLKIGFDIKKNSLNSEIINNIVNISSKNIIKSLGLKNISNTIINKTKTKKQKVNKKKASKKETKNEASKKKVAKKEASKKEASKKKVAKKKANKKETKKEASKKKTTKKEANKKKTKKEASKKRVAKKENSKKKINFNFKKLKFI